jgi:hypothetical protein
MMGSPFPDHPRDPFLEKKKSGFEDPKNYSTKIKDHYEFGPEFEKELTSPKGSQVSIKVMEEIKPKFTEPLPDDSQNRPLITYSNDNSARSSFMHPDLLNPNDFPKRRSTSRDSNRGHIDNFKEKQDALSPNLKETGTFSNQRRSPENLDIKG